MLNDQINDGERERWDKFILSSKFPSFLQSWAWGEMQNRLGIAYWRLVVGEAGELKAVALVTRHEMPLGRCWLYVPRGDPSDLLREKLLELAKNEKAVFVRVDPPVPEISRLEDRFSFRKSEKEVQPRHTLVLDLAEEEKLLAGMHHKTRYNIRLAERKGVTVRFSKEHKDVKEFLRLSKDVMERGNFHFHPDDYYRTMLDVLAPAGMLELAVAEYDGVVLGVFLLIRYGTTVTYAHGATSSTLREIMAPHLLMWESIKRAKQQGAKHFDFFGVAPPGSGKSHPWSGVTRFKKGFGGRRENYAGAYDYVLQPGMYALFNLARRARGVLLFG
ncbi:MAG: peptidoglycan bridge formation glycyltransferase FemA/FemB family protein [bacterium]